VARRLILFAVIYATAGLLASIAVNALVLLGVRPRNGLFLILSLGVFPLGALVLYCARFVAPTKISFFDLAANSECPRWLRMMTYGVWAYSFATWIFVSRAESSGGLVELPLVPFSVWRDFSATWMALYSTALTLVATAYLKFRRIRG
jgi:hypothetical protein